MRWLATVLLPPVCLGRRRLCRASCGRLVRGTLLLGWCALAAPLHAQAGPRKAPGPPPRISARTFASGSAQVRVTGGFQIDADVPINVAASIADGEMTWLQFGASGSQDPNALFTISPSEIGLSAGQGARLFVAEAASCTGHTEVSAAAVAGEYTCKGITSYDAATRRMSTVAVTIRFTARSAAGPGAAWQ